jgi:cytochrome c-type biogenesis protein CcmH
VASAARPDDIQGHVLLARNEAALGNFTAAYEAQEKLLSLKGAAADATDYLTYADLMILAAGGYVSPQAENALRAALARDPENGAARYYLGLMMRQNGRPDVAFRLWDQLLRQGPEDAAWIPPIRAQIDEAARLAGVDYEQPRPSESLAGPSAADIEAAGELSDEDRQEMIRGMVSRLSDRLASQGGSPAEWARLISAYGVLGDVARARAIANEARQVFAAVPEAIQQIEAAETSLPPLTATPETETETDAQPEGTGE